MTRESLQAAGHPVLDLLRAPDPLATVELRPPGAALAPADTMDAWIDLHHAIQGFSRRGLPVFLTDQAVGTAEEENLGHVTANLGPEVELSRIVPFLTCKHTLEYCLLYAQRAWSHGFRALTVLGGDRSVGPPRCVPHAYELRRRIRERVPELALGGWANPHRDPAEQVEFITRGDFEADFYLTQVVSHHDAGRVEAFLEEADRRGVERPGVFGVFFYRSANRRTLERLNEFFPVPVEALEREFGEGASAEEVCARTVRALRRAGATKLYLSNLGTRRAGARYRRVMDLAGE